MKDHDVPVTVIPYVFDSKENQAHKKRADFTLEPEAGGFAPDAIVAALHALGLRRILVEGGADTLARFLDAGAVDLLHVLVAPMILGSGKEGFRLAPVDSLDEALRPVTRVHAFDDGDVLFTCDLRRSWQRD